MVTEQEYNVAREQANAAEKIIQQYHLEQREVFNARWERFDKNHEAFTDADLIYAATARCSLCGAGMAYPKGCGPNHQWTCSNVLKNIGTDKGHTALPFAFYEIKSENQPSAQGETTRPK